MDKDEYKTDYGSRRTALSAPSIPTGVKGLEWEGNFAPTPVGDYRVTVAANGYYAYHALFGSVGLIVDSLESAKAAAQADYERRILSALSPAQPGLEGDTKPLTRTMSACTYSATWTTAGNTVRTNGFRGLSSATSWP